MTLNRNELEADRDFFKWAKRDTLILDFRCAHAGEDMLRIFVMGGPPNLGGGGMPHLILMSSRLTVMDSHDGSFLIGKHARHARQIARHVAGHCK